MRPVPQDSVEVWWPASRATASVGMGVKAESEVCSVFRIAVSKRNMVIVERTKMKTSRIRLSVASLIDSFFMLAAMRSLVIRHSVSAIYNV